MEILESVAIVIPIYRNELSEFEAISLHQAGKVLGVYPFTLITCENVNTNCHEMILSEYKVKVRRVLFKPTYFKSISGYNRLLTSLHFYQTFIKYKYILILQLDVFVFKDELAEWCRRGHDFVGAPWLHGMNEAKQDASYFGVGNGGFSLRSVKSAIRVLKSFSYIRQPRESLNRFRAESGVGIIKRLIRMFRDFTFANNTFSLLNNYSGYEDHFWGIIARRNFKWYRVPEPEEALMFSIEVQPRSLFERNRSVLPFGCHAWWRYDLEFWRPFIEKEGHVLSVLDE